MGRRRRSESYSGRTDSQPVLSQAQLAERAGLSTDAVSALEQGVRRSPYPETVRRLADALALCAGERAALLATVSRSRGGRRATVAARPALTTPLALPQPLTGLVDRQREATEISELLSRPGVRLLTLTGLGGVGKTRLALEVARRLEGERPGGVAFASLAELRDPDHVLPAIARALGIRADGSLPVEELLAANLHDREMLLVVDNCEHLPDAALAMARVLERCPGLTVVATSRIPLGIAGERRFPVPPLDVRTGAGRHADLVDLGRMPAVELFVDRAAARVPGFALTAQNAAAVVDVCSRLDGLPLAIELAAARTVVLPPDRLLERLDRRLSLLVGGPRDVPERQRTLRGTIAWSYELLGEAEQRLFRALSVFRGGCTIDMTAAVCVPITPTEQTRGAAEAFADEIEMLQGFESLIDKGLVIRDEDRDGTPRFRMLDTVREYAAEMLAACGEEEALRRHLAEAVLALAQMAEPELIGPAQQQWIARLDAERENVRAALAWTVDRGESELGMRVLRSLWRWFTAVLMREGRDWADRLLRLPEQPVPPTRAWALFVQGALSIGLGEFPRARAALEESVAIWRAEGRTRELGYALAWLAFTRRHGVGDQDWRDSQESLGLLRRSGDRWGLATALVFAGFIATSRGDAETAGRLFHESLALFRALGDSHMTAFVLFSIGRLETEHGTLGAAQERFEQSLALYQTLHHPFYIGVVRVAMAQAAQLAGQVDVAAVNYVESLILARQFSDRRTISRCLAGLAWVASRRERHRPAALLIGAATTLNESLGLSLYPLHRALDEPATAEVRATLGDAVFEETVAEGRVLPLEQAIGAALEEEG